MGVISEVEPVSPEQEKPASREFRPEIQALRAIAVMSVVLYHLWPVQLPGGFVGVDVFFVISGFLITQHLVGELRRTGTISLTQFWARRIRRLLPAAFTVLVACTLLLFLFMPMATWTQNVQEIAASATYVENWLLAHNAVDYLAAENVASLVQHYWSLSVEEQFYLVWPLILLLCAAVVRWLRRDRQLLAVRSALLVVFLLSFGASIVMTHQDAANAFFVTPTRAWEFAAGGLLAAAPARLTAAQVPVVRALTSWAGLALIGFAVLYITGAQPFPGYIAVLPVAGAVLIIAGGTSSVRWSSAPLARLSFVQWLGNYSYSIYLWHWPLIIAGPWVVHAHLGNVAKVVILAASLLLAWATKHVIEDPIRTGARWRVHRWPSYTFALAGMVVFLAVSTLATGNVNSQNQVAAKAAATAIADNTPCYGAAAIVDRSTCPDAFLRTSSVNTAFAAADLSGSEECQQHLTTPALKLCAFGDTQTPARTVVLVGNSHALRLMPALDRYGQQHHWKVILASKTDCLGMTTRPIGNQKASDSCLTWSAQLQKALLAMPQLDAVIFANHVQAADYLAGTQASTADLDEADTQILATWSALRARGVVVMLAQDVPGVRPESGPDCVARPRSGQDPCAMPRTSVLESNFLDALAKAHPELIGYLPTSQFFCDATTCHALIGGVVVYSDGHHLTRTYSRTMAPYLGAEVTRVFTSMSGNARTR